MLEGFWRFPVSLGDGPGSEGASLFGFAGGGDAGEGAPEGLDSEQLATKAKLMTVKSLEGWENERFGKCII